GIAKRYDAAIEIRHGDRRADAKSMISLLQLGAGANAQLTVTARGSQAAEALEAVRAIDRAGIRTRRAIEVVNWTNEEGARFSPGLMGSAVFAGTLGLATAHASMDRAGRRFGDELARIGYRGDTPVGGRPVDSYLELHIEQGPELEESGTTIAAVTHSHFTGFATIEIWGENSHSQTMPMARRRNALAGAGRLIEAVERIAAAHRPEGKASPVVLDVWPQKPGSASASLPSAAASRCISRRRWWR
ncbi:MAG: M20/M25/M40 family metallo-hydrolase, partial [Roseomonas mucosa]|nr:M20/M25/M40 family metallo-hydrolase [Roseomonas mucosa]